MVNLALVKIFLKFGDWRLLWMILLLVIVCFIAFSIGSVLFIIWKILGFSGLWVVTNARVFLSIDFSAGFRNVSWGDRFRFSFHSLLFLWVALMT